MSISDQLLAGLKEHFEYVLIGVGLFILVGAIRGWAWLLRPNRNQELDNFVWELWGERGMRVLMALCGLGLIACGITYMILMP